MRHVIIDASQLELEENVVSIKSAINQKNREQIAALADELMA